MNCLAYRVERVATFIVAISVLMSISALYLPDKAAAQSSSAGQNVLVDPARPIIYWAGAEGNDLKFINSSDGVIIDSIVVGEQPSSICLSSDGTALYVALPLYKCIVVVDVDSHSITGNISLPFDPLSIRLDGNGFMYVSGTGSDSGRIFSVNMNTWKVKGDVAPGSGDLVIEISPDGSILLAMQIDSNPVKIYKYGIDAGNFNYVDVDNHDLGSYLQQEAVDWARGRIYLASTGPYGIQLVSVDTLDELGLYPMDANPSSVAMSNDGRFVYGANENNYQPALWMFNATSGDLVGKMSLGSSIDLLAIGHDFRSAYIGPSIQRIPLTPVIDHLYPVHLSVLGYTPRYFAMGLSGGVPHYDGQNATIYVDGVPLSIYPFDVLGDWTYFRADFSQVLPEGNHNFSVALRWMDQILWGNATFVVDRDAPDALRPMLTQVTPSNGSIELVEPLTIGCRIVYTSSDFVTEGGWIMLDDYNMSTAFTLESLTASSTSPLSLGWHNVSAYVYWDGGLGCARTNWSFLVMHGPLLTPVFPAEDQVLTQMPDHIEVAIDLMDTGGNVSAPLLFLDYNALETVIGYNGTMWANITPLTRAGNHEARATLDWQGGRAMLSWQFELDMFVGPTGEVLTHYKYKDEFSLLVPQGESWSIETDAEVAGSVFPLVMSGPVIDEFMTNVIVQSGHDSAVEETEAYLQDQLDRAIDDLEQSGIDVTLVVVPELRYVDNHTAYVATIQWYGYAMYQEVAIIASEAHEMIWTIILSVNMNGFGSYSRMFDDMVDSFTIEMEPISALNDLAQEGIGLGIAALAGGLAGAIVWLTRKRRPPISPLRP